MASELHFPGERVCGCGESDARTNFAPPTDACDFVCWSSVISILSHGRQVLGLHEMTSTGYVCHLQQTPACAELSGFRYSSRSEGRAGHEPAKRVQGYKIVSPARNKHDKSDAATSRPAGRRRRPRSPHANLEAG